ncbi:MAG: hypothetical protein KGI38_07855 [Thaumarchaeota archaeon]|nr:hypothetical protein [Nitrososphaerota archaeon]
MKGARGSAIKVGLSACLLVLGVLVSIALPPSFLGKSDTVVETIAPLGRLVVAVNMYNGSLIPGPLSGVQVAVAGPLRVHFIGYTNKSGEFEWQLASGQYGVSVTDPRFATETSAAVRPGILTTVQVSVNRTESYSIFSAAEDSTTQGKIETWNQLVVEVSLYPYYFPLPYSAGAFVVLNAPISPIIPSLPTFGEEVFVQPFGAGPTGCCSPAKGGEVPAKVVSQFPGQGAVWLTLQPLSLLDLAGAYFLGIVSYQAGSSVSYSSG